MKKQKYLFLLIMAVAFSFASCDKDEDEKKETCDKEDLAADFGCPTNIDAVATFCTDGENKSYYSFRGKKYYCTGVDANTCEDARGKIGTILSTDGCSSKIKNPTGIANGEAKLSEMAERLLDKVRENAICN